MTNIVVFLLSKIFLIIELNKDNTYNERDHDPIKIPRFEEKGGFYASAKSSAIMKKIKSKNTNLKLN